MIKDIWYLITKQSESKMKGMDMGWEWNWPYRYHTYGTTWFDLEIRTDRAYDHSPGFHCSLVILNWCLLDFGYYNSYHMIDDDE
jgi:hypothetical protein